MCIVVWDRKQFHHPERFPCATCHQPLGPLASFVPRFVTVSRISYKRHPLVMCSFMFGFFH